MPTYRYIQTHAYVYTYRLKNILLHVCLYLHKKTHPDLHAYLTICIHTHACLIQTYTVCLYYRVRQTFILVCLQTYTCDFSIFEFPGFLNFQISLFMEFLCIWKYGNPEKLKPYIIKLLIIINYY